MRAKYLIILLFSLPVCKISFSQKNISGTWEGKFLSYATDLGQPKLVVEIFDFKDSLFTGLSHLYYEGDKYEHYKISGRYLKQDSLLVFRETVTISVDLGIYGNCLGTYLMKLSGKGNTDMLDGIWMSNKKYCTDDVKVWLKKEKAEIKVETIAAKKPPLVTKPVFRTKPNPQLPVAKRQTTTVVTSPTAPVEKNIPVIKTAPAVMPAILKQRETDVQSLLEIASADKDSIRVDVYDNGEIDGDSVSVYEEGVQRISKKLITAKPITFYVSLNKNVNPIVHLRLIAENLGTIPPCTALMIVTTKSRRYEVRLSSNFRKNATVELFLKE